MDKVFAPKTLAVAWTKVRANKGASLLACHPQDGRGWAERRAERASKKQRFAAKAELYLSELSTALRTGTYHPQAVKRVDIPKSDGRTRPLGIPTVKDRIVPRALRTTFRRQSGS